MSVKMKYLILVLAIISCKSVLSQSNWELILPPGPTSNQLVSLHFIDQTTGWAVGEYGTILKTTNAGENWRLIEIPQYNYLTDVYFPTQSVGFAVGKDGFIIKSVDGGESWSQQTIRFTNNLHRVRFRDENNGWIVGEKGLILHTGDGGMNWEQQISNSRESLNGLSLIPDTSGVFVVGNDSTILVTYDEGENWQRKSFVPRITGRTYFNFKDVYFLNDSQGWIGGIGGYYGILIFTTDGGYTWREFQVYDTEYTDFHSHFHIGGGFPAIQQIYFTHRRHGLCLTSLSFSNNSNVPLYTNSSGQKWTSEVIGSCEAFRQAGRLAYLSENRIINTGYRGEFRISSDNGVTWGFMNQEKRNFYFLFIGNQGNLLGKRIVGDDEYQWSYSIDYGKNWQSFTPQFYDPDGRLQTGIDIPYSGNFIDDYKTLRAVCYDRSLDTLTKCIYESNDIGRSWKLVHIPAHKDLALAKFLTADTLIRYLMYEREVSPGKYQAKLLFTYSFDCGRIARTDTFLTIWNKNKNTYPFISKSYFFNSHTGFLVGSEGNIIKTTNTGQSWANIPSGVVEDLWDITFVNRQTGFVVGDFGRILKTVDGGQTWRKTDSGTQEGVYSIGFKNETEGWAGTETGLRYTTDGGETWQGVPLRYFHGPIREIEFDKDGTGYAYTHKFYENEDWDSRPGGYILLLVLKEGGVVVENAPGTVPRQFSLSQNYPNPFNSTTHIRFSLPETEKISLKIFNIQGQLVRTLLDETRKAGEHAVVWDGTTNNGKMTASGIYIYRLTRNGEVRVRKLLLLK